jgi:AhpD family alkylhydroperoxidase
MVADSRVAPSSLNLALSDFSRRVNKMSEVDEFTKELVRLRQARFVGCKFCMSVRSATARRLGMDETISAQLTAETRPVDDLCDLSDHQRSAVQLADAFLNYPTPMGSETAADLRRNFTPEQTAELLLKLIAHRGSKPYIAMGQNADPTRDGPLLYEYAEDGSLVFQR